MRSPFLDFAASWKREDAIIPNTFFGGIGGTVTDEATLASQINEVANSGVILLGSDILLFEIDSANNIRCNIQKPYSNGSANFKSDNTTFYYDFEGNIIKFQQSFFGINSPLERVISLSSGLLIIQSFRLTPLEYAILPNISGSNGNGNFGQITSLKRVYLPNWEDFTTNARYFGSVRPNTAKMYFDSSMETVDNGSPHPSIVFSTSLSGDSTKAEAVFIQNYDKPNPVTDLSVSNITANSAQLDFTAPTVNTNANDFYYVYIDYAGISFKFAYNTAQEISAFYDEITVSGDTITGLPGGSQISVQVQTVDIYHNVSGYSNKVTFTTI